MYAGVAFGGGLSPRAKGTQSIGRGDTNSLEALIQAMNDLPRHLIEDKEIRSLAYRLYEDAGRPEGRADEHWATAEQIIRSRHTSRPDRPSRIKNMFRKRKLRSFF